MSHFVIFDLTTGQIVQSCQAPSLASATTCAQAGQDALEVLGAVDNTAVYVLAGQLVEVPVAPTEHHVFDWVSKAWSDPRTDETQWALVRASRDKLLATSDWIVTRAADTGVPMRADWQEYRQALRDVTLQPDPFNITWPLRP